MEVWLSQFTIGTSADPDEFERSLKDALARAMKEPPVRTGRLAWFRLLKREERKYALEFAGFVGLMRLPGGLAATIESAGAVEPTLEAYEEVFASDDPSV